MFVVTRKSGEWISLDDEIQIKVFDVNDGCVSVGIDAPRHFNITNTQASHGAALRNGIDRKQSRSRYLRVRKTLKHACKAESVAHVVGIPLEEPGK